MNPFGGWQKCRHGRNHYFLDGAPLCGAAIKETGEEPERVKYRGCAYGPYRSTGHCPGCSEQQVLRWIKLGKDTKRSK